MEPFPLSAQAEGKALHSMLGDHETCQATRQAASLSRAAWPDA